MNISKMQRRAFGIAILTMAGAMALVLVYWQGVRKGVLPAPSEPMVARPTPPLRQAAAVSARPPEAALPRPSVTVSPPPAVPPMGSSSSARSPAMPVKTPAAAPAPSETVSNLPAAVLPKIEQAIRRSELPAAVPAPRTVPEAVAPARTLAELHPIDPVDQKVAEQWLANTNQRPVLRVRYDTGEILHLVESGRGMVVASGSNADPKNRRELYLKSGAGGAPLFAPYTTAVAAGFSAYSLTLEPTAALARLTATLPLYFPSGAASLSFVPDSGLAVQIFAEVAHAARNLPAASAGVGKAVFEGELTVEGDAPRFRVVSASPL